MDNFAFSSLLIFLFLLIAFWSIKTKRNNQSLFSYSIDSGKANLFAIISGISMTFVGGAATINMASIGYQFGYWALVDPFAVLTATILIAFLLTKKIRSKKGITISDLLSGPDNKLSLLISSIVLFVYLLFTAAQIVALSKLFTPYVGNTYYLLSYVPALLVFVYVILGGFRTVTTTDKVQFVCLLLFLVLPVLFLPLSDNQFISSNIEKNNFITMPVNLIILFLLPLLFMPVSQDVHLRVKAARDNNSAKLGLWVGGLAYFIFVCSSIYAGYSLNINGVKLDDPESALINFFIINYPRFSVISHLAVITAVMSTLDSFVFSSIVTISNDFFSKRTKLFPENRIIIISSVIVFLISFSIAIFFQQILGLILAGLLIYVSILIPLSIGRKLSIRDSHLFWIASVVIVFILLSEYFELKINPKAIIYPLVHCFLLVLFSLQSRFFNRKACSDE